MKKIFPVRELALTAIGKAGLIGAKGKTDGQEACGREKSQWKMTYRCAGVPVCVLVTRGHKHTWCGLSKGEETRKESMDETRTGKKQYVQ